jgi:hypothetical protein
MKRAALTIAVALLSAPAAAQSVEYVYTKFDAKNCKHTKGTEVEDYGSWLCPGYKNLPVRLSAGDQRMYVTFGPRTKDNIADGETFPGFNDVYEGTVEWRIEKRVDGKERPFATILRWNLVTAEDQEKATGPIKPSGRVLVVTRLGAGRHVPYRIRRRTLEGCERAGAQARRRTRAHVQVREGQGGVRIGRLICA